MNTEINWPLIFETFPDLDFHSTEALDGILRRMVLNSREQRKRDAELKKKAETLAFLKRRDEARRSVRAVGNAQPLKRGWRNILNLHGEHITIEDVDAAYRALATEHHPDKGGDAFKMAELNVARRLAKEELSR